MSGAIRAAGRAAGAAILAALLGGPPAAGAEPPTSPLRRAAVSEALLAAEEDGDLFLEVLAAPGDTALTLAAVYAESRSAAAILRAANGGTEPVAGRFYRIPFGTLRDDHRRLALAALYPDELPRAPLEYGTDEGGDFAVYRLREGEALYSGVVVRFTGTLEVKEVNDLAALVARRSGIDDERNIPVGFPVKIPVEHLLPEFLPPGSPARQEYEAAVVAAARHGLAAPARLLEGVHVILDAGHGGKDPGAIASGVYEDEHAYDVMCRVAGLLKGASEAEVYTTIWDRSSGCRPLDGHIGEDTDESLVRGRLVRGSGGGVALDGAAVFNLRRQGATKRGVNDRFALANEWMEDLSARGVDRQKVVFISFHADALHPSIRGAMIYVPGTEDSRYLPRGISKGDREEAIGLSRQLARRIMAGLRKREIVIHPEPAIRDRIVRGRSRYIPAVIRETTVPHALLVEVANLNSREDRRLLVRGEFRQRFAEAVVEALVDHYGSPETPHPTEAEVARLD